MPGGTRRPSLDKVADALRAAEQVNHPSHYGGADNPYEAIKVIEALDLGFHLGNAVKYILRAGKKQGQDADVDLKKALWYVERKIQKIEDQRLADQQAALNAAEERTR